MKKLAVCGDSFFSPISYDPNDLNNGHDKHFTEILAKKLGWELINFARGGCGNQTIRLQIEESIKWSPNFVIVGTTSPDRFEYPVKHTPTQSYNHKYSEEVTKLGYQELNGLSNINYINYPDRSAENDIFKINASVLFSDTLNNIFSSTTKENEGFLKREDIRTLEKWYDRFYDFGWKTQTDTWIISDGLNKLKENKINFRYITSFLFENQLFYLNDKIINKDSPLNPNNYVSINENVPYRFHTTLRSQEILADLWFKYIIEHHGK